MTHRPTPRRFTGTPPTRALRLGDPPYPYLLADCGRDLEALPRRMVRLGDGPYRLPGQEGSAATTITRDCSGNLTRGSSRRTSPFSTTPTTATGWRWRRRPSRGRGCSPGRMAGWGRCGSEASCSSRTLRRSLLRSGWGVGKRVDSQSGGGDDEGRRLLDPSEHGRSARRGDLEAAS